MIKGLRARCIIGDEDWERIKAQDVRVDIELGCEITAAGKSDDLSDTIDYARVSEEIISYIKNSRFRLVEALAEGVAQVCLSMFHVHAVTVKLYKKSHVAGVDEFGVFITRSRQK